MDLAAIERHARERKIPIILDEGLQIIINCVKQIKPRRILEIGTAIGYSAIAMLSAAEITCELDTIELDETRLSEAKRNFAAAQLTDRINCYKGDCVEILPSVIEDKMYDLVFIDAAKSKYLDCYKAVENNVNIGGIVAADNVYFRGMVMSDQEPPRKYRAIVKNLRKFIQYINANVNYDVVIYSEGDGVAVCKRR